jgi:cytoskeletal protein RodZ
MRRRRKRNSGLKWLVILVVLGAAGWYGMQAYKARDPQPQAAVVSLDPTTPAVATQSAPLPPPAAATGAQVPATTPTTTFVAEAEARDAAARQAREQTLKVQQRLRENDRARKAAAETPSENERCIDGQKMKRVDNGWVQSGTC